MKSIKMFGKSVPLIAIVMIAVLSVGTFAALITQYGSVVTTVPITQSVLVDGGTDPVIETFALTVAGTTVNRLHTIENRADVFADVVFDTTYIPGLADTEIVTRYDTEITDETDFYPALFGKSSYELVTIVPDPNLDLDALFAGNGLQYSYTVIDGGHWEGASPIVAIIHLDDGRHIALFPGWGARTGTHTLEFSETVAYDTGGNNLVDFALYPADFSVWLYGSGANKNFAEVKADTGLLDGTELVASVVIAHQSGWKEGSVDDGNTDRLDSLSYASESYEFAQILEGVTYTLAPGQKMHFVTRYIFGVNLKPEQYIITTTVSPPT